MAEAFSNKLTRAAGIVSTSSAGSIGIQTNLITGISTVDVTVNQLIDNSNYILGTKVSSVGASQVVVDRDSTNTSATSSQSVKFLGVTSSVNLTINVFDNSASAEVGLAANIPVPQGSSFVISDTGKTVLESSDEVRIYCDTANAIDATLSVLTGVS